MEQHYSRLAAVLEKSYANRDLTLELLAEVVHLSPTYINQILRKSTGKTFVQLLHERRVRAACEHLKHNTLSVREVAEKVGFSSSKHFIRVFKELTGVTPGRYR